MTSTKWSAHYKMAANSDWCRIIDLILIIPISVDLFAISIEKCCYLQKVTLILEVPDWHLAQNQGKCDLSLSQNKGNMRTIKYLVVHCTATPHSTTIDSIQNYWRTNLKWKSPGYHKVIKPNGDVITLAPDDTVCNGVAGYNSVSLHISYIGGVDSRGNPVDNRTQGQKDALSQALHEWRSKYPSAKILGHRDFPKVAKACPSFNAVAEYAHI